MKSRAFLRIEQVSNLNQLVFALNQWGRKIFEKRKGNVFVPEHPISLSEKEDRIMSGEMNEI